MSNIITCWTCEMEFSSEEEKDTHLSIPDTECYIDNILNTGFYNTSIDYYDCYYCNNSFIEPTDLQQHLNNPENVCYYANNGYKGEIHCYECNEPLSEELYHIYKTIENTLDKQNVSINSINNIFNNINIQDMPTFCFKCIKEANERRIEEEKNPSCIGCGKKDKRLTDKECSECYFERTNYENKGPSYYGMLSDIKY